MKGWSQPKRGMILLYRLRHSTSLGIRITQFCMVIGRALKLEPRVNIHPPAPGDVRRTFADISKARRLFGYDPRIGIEDGIQQFVRWYRKDNGRAD